MKIGILTFHWATNYGAVLQTYALQSCLEDLGHTVSVINYKPVIYDYNIWNFFFQQHFRRFKEYYKNKKMELELAIFRKHYLNLTRRINKCNDISDIISEYDILISGSDQVLNPYFLKSGEGKNIYTPTYFLRFPFQGRKIAYAVSFGCNDYPSEQLNWAREYLKDFQVVGVREKSGISITRKMGANSPMIVPDPTALLTSFSYVKLASQSRFRRNGDYVFAFFIRNIEQRKEALSQYFKDKVILWNNDDNEQSMQSWLQKIHLSEFVITDSFHCVMMCLQMSKQFVVITEQSGKEGMNDRLFTLLEPMGLESHILHKGEIYKIPQFLNSKYDKNVVSSVLEQMRNKGLDFLRALS